MTPSENEEAACLVLKHVSKRENTERPREFLFIPSSDDKQAFAPLCQSMLGQILDLVANIIASFTDIIQQHIKVLQMPTVRRKSKSLF